MAKDTKKRIIEAALVLFSRNGYDATTMIDIANMVGIKAPSLYAHYKNKQTIFDAMVSTMREYFWEAYPSMHTHAGSEADEARLIANDIHLAEELAVRAFKFYFEDEYAETFRKLLSIERYKNPQMDAVFRELYIDAPIDNQTELFAEMIRQGYMYADVDPRIAAYEMYAPMFFLMYRYDGMPGEDDAAIREVIAHVDQFIGRYLTQK